MSDGITVAWVQTIEIDRTVAEWFVREHPNDFPALLAFVRQEAEASIESLARHIASLPAPSEP